MYLANKYFGHSGDFQNHYQGSMFSMRKSKIYILSLVHAVFCAMQCYREQWYNRT